MRDAQLGRRYTLVLQKQESTLSLLSSIGETAQPIMSMPLWRNRLARSAVNREAGGSSPPRGAIFFSLSPCQRKGASGGQQWHTSLGCRLFVFLYVVFKTPDSGGMMVLLLLNIYIDKKNLDPGRTRTCNPLIRSQMPYPLGHRASVGQ